MNSRHVPNACCATLLPGETATQRIGAIRWIAICSKCCMCITNRCWLRMFRGLCNVLQTKGLGYLRKGPSGGQLEIQRRFLELCVEFRRTTSLSCVNANTHRCFRRGTLDLEYSLAQHLWLIIVAVHRRAGQRHASVVFPSCLKDLMHCA